MARLLALPHPPTGVVTAGARISVGAYSCARERGARIPGELSFVGFSDAPAHRWWGEGLTTIGLPVEDIATAAMDCLMRRAERRDALPDRPVQVMHRPILVERGSTAPPPKATAKGRKRAPGVS
jgi:LacI family transcriptional regulator